MKKLSISLLVMLLIASLFTSCSMGSDDASDVRVKVRLTPSGGGRSLTTDIETINLDDDSITWHYSATKVSETQFNYGATSDSLLPKDGIVTLSQGEWNIELRGFKDGKKVYTGTTNNVTIKWNFYEPNVTVPVTVKQNTGDYGYIVLTDVKIPVNDELKTPNFASIDSTIIMNFNGVNMRLECIPGPHTVTFEYRSDNGDVKSSKSLVVEVISGRETTISGNIDKSEITSGSSSLTEVKQAIEVKKDGNTVVNVLVAPANTSSNLNQTTVTFPQGALHEEATTAVLNLSVKSADSNDFSVASTGSSSPVAGIDISLKVNEQEVTSFNNEYVVITTYILAGLESVEVKYNGTDGDQPILVSYNSGTGELVFKTNHFSEYYVLADCKIVNTTTNVGYSDFNKGYTDANNGDVLIITADEIDFPVELSEKDNITIKGRSDINKTKVRLLKTLNEGMNNLVMENLDFIQTSTLTIQGTSITFNNCDFSAKETSYFDVPAGLNNNGYTDITTINNANDIIFNNCKFSGKGTDYDLPNARLISSPKCTNLTINESEFSDCFSALWYSNVSGMMKVNSSIFNCYAYTIHSGGDVSCEIAISDSSLNGWTSFASSTNTSASFDRCSFGKYNGYNCMVPYMNTTFNECIFDKNYEIYNRYNTQKSISFEKCKKGGTDITKDNFISLFKNEEDEETVYLWNRSNCYVNGDLLEKDAAEINKKFYATLEDAVRAAVDNDIIVLQKSTSGNGIGLYESGDNISKIKTKNITIDFNNFTYTIDGTLQGSTGTVSQAFHLEKDCSVTLKNGTLTSSNASMLIQNYCDLTLDNMNLIFGKNYPLSNNSGNIIIKDTTITANDGEGIAFDVYSFGDYNGTTVTVIGNSIINGKVELDRTNNADLKLVIEGGEFKNDICKEVSSNCIVEIKGGTFSKDPSAYVDETNYNVTQNDDSTWTVSAK